MSKEPQHFRVAKMVVYVALCIFIGLMLYKNYQTKAAYEPPKKQVLVHLIPENYEGPILAKVIPNGTSSYLRNDTAFVKHNNIGMAFLAQDHLFGMPKQFYYFVDKEGKMSKKCPILPKSNRLVHSLDVEYISAIVGDNEEVGFNYEIQLGKLIDKYILADNPPTAFGNLDTIPDKVYQKILDLPKVREIEELLKDKGNSVQFYTLRNPETIDDCFVLKLVEVDDLKMTTIFNYHYYPTADSLFYLNTTTDSLLYIQI